MKVSHKNFPATRRRRVEVEHQLGVIGGFKIGAKVFPDPVTKRTVAHGKLFDHTRPEQGNLDALDGVHDKQPEVTVENIAPPDSIQSCSRSERIVRPFKRVPVGAEPVITDIEQPGLNLGYIGCNQSTRM